jgi:hypothetical protein
MHLRWQSAALVFCVCIAFGAQMLPAQARSQTFAPASGGITRVVPAQPAVERTGASALFMEAAGAAAGSALGFGLIYLTAGDCAVEDLGCTLDRVFVGIALGTAASVGGAVIAGRAYDTDPSTLGAVLGAIAGAAGAIGLWGLFTEKLDVGNHSGAAAVTFVGTQALMTALGSRIVRALK